MFHNATTFNGVLSKWDVSNVQDMSYMFLRAVEFNGDISKWDVSSITDTSCMFSSAKLFNGDISQWDVSSVDNMDFMFSDVTSFKRKICGAALFRSKASKHSIFTRSSGSISQITCTPIPAFSPHSKTELKSAVDEYLKLCPRGGCSSVPHGPIGEWDVSRVSDMSHMHVLWSNTFQWRHFEVGRVTRHQHEAHVLFADFFDGDLSNWIGMCRACAAWVPCSMMRQHLTATFRSGTYQTCRTWVICSWERKSLTAIFLNGTCQA